MARHSAPCNGGTCREGRLAPDGDGADTAAGFIPAVITPEPAAGAGDAEESGALDFPPGSPGRGRMEIVARGGRRVIVGAAVLGRVLRALEG